MLKLLGSLMLIFCGGATGYLYSFKLLMRKNFLEQYLHFLNFTQTQIRYSRDPPSRILIDYDGEGGFQVFLRYCREQLDNGQVFPLAWQRATNQIKKDTGLTTADISLLREFGEKLGTSDLQGELEHCALHIDRVNVNLSEARELKRQKGRLYTTLGLASGIGLALLFL